VSQSEGVREINFEGKRIALIIRSEAKGEGKTLFFSNSEDGFQLALAGYPSGHRVEAHSHLSGTTAPPISQEWIFVREGECAVSLFQQDGNLIDIVELKTGDGILIYDVYHALEAVKSSEILLLKQGPFNPGSDKTRLGSQ